MGGTGIGTSILDVSDPSSPRLVAQLAVPPHTHSHKVQVVGDIMLVNYEQFGRAGRGVTGLKVFDVARPDTPREIGFLPMEGKGVHRMTYWEPPYAYVTGSDAGWTDQFFMAVDFSDPAAPHEVGRWWLPGMWTAGGEQPSAPAGRRYALHHALTRGDRAYMGWWDAGLVILDIADKTRPHLVSQLNFGAEVSGCTHTALPIPGKAILIVTDESTADNCAEVPKIVRVVDIADERHPNVIASFPVPEGDFCTRGGWFGAHNIHEMRPGSLIDPNTIYVTYFNAGVRVVDISDPAAPREIAHFVPEAPAGRPVIQMNDITVAANGLIYATDRHAGGLYVFELLRR
ncbi:MAG: LVIVD repeat-containing protein, partial [Dehalococcoidia bacterium]